MKLLIATDHAGFELKEAIKTKMKSSRKVGAIEWIDLGTHSADSVDYPDNANAMAEAIKTKKAEFGVLLCGSGIGVSIAANRHKGIRAALVENPIAARLAREHNYANVLCIGARFVACPYAMEMIEAWLAAEPNLDERHARRVKKMG